MDIVDKPYYNVTKYIIILTGLSLHHPKWFNFLSKFYIFFIHFSFIGVQIAGMIKRLGDIDLVLECVTPACYAIMSSILYINTNLHVKQVISLNFLFFFLKGSFVVINVIFWKMQSDWDTLTSKHEVKILSKYGRKCKIYTTIYTFVLYGNVLFYYSAHGIPLLIQILQHSDEPKPLIFLIECGIDSQKYYSLILIYSYMFGLTCTFGTVNGGTILVMFLEHACGIFDIIGHKLTTAIKENPDFDNKISTRKKLLREIKICVALHRRVILFVNDAQDAYATAYLLVFGVLIINLSITGVQCVTNLKNSGDGLRFGCYILCQVFHIYALTLPTQHLLDTSLSLSSVIYNAEWYHLSTESKKLLLIIMRKGTEPTTFVVGKIFILSLQFFTKKVHH
ncbi:uncharacterized protein LOC127290461 isoform X2 [Leptopilina boulardi]|uniref:uncharacterized protein LOC127290461 isoform X2 n=1 Tax=Leptopilina boulardi TaxID=63433 RepID=UPI0021F51686|nr:uncharacterized protein LOC127290461 isoform X2 [Leptopilina boulardi]